MTGAISRGQIVDELEEACHSSPLRLGKILVRSHRDLRKYPCVSSALSYFTPSLRCQQDELAALSASRDGLVTRDVLQQLATAGKRALRELHPELRASIQRPDPLTS